MVDAYYPASLEEALEIRKAQAIIPYGGGTDLMVRESHDRPFLFIGDLEELRTVEAEGDRLLIGSACTYGDLLEHGEIPEVLRRAVEGIAAPAIRNLGTLGGNICNASPAGDSLPVLYALGAELTLRSDSGERVMPVDQFILGVRKTALAEDEILTRIGIPLSPGGFSFTKIGARKSLAISKLVFCGVHRMEEDVIREIGIAFGAVGPVILRSREIEKSILGRKRSGLDIEGILGEYGKLIRPIDDQRSTAEYRRKTCLNLLREYLSTGL